MSVITALSLRSPENAARAVEVGAGDLAVQAMRKFPAAYQMQKQCCLMIRNLVARNPENRYSLSVEIYIIYTYYRTLMTLLSCRQSFTTNL